jgi:hypothetical protein
MEKRIIVVFEQKVILDPEKLGFTEATLSEYLEHEGGWYDYIGQKLADAEREMADKEHAHDVIYSERFRENKDNGCSDKLAEATSKADDDVQRAKEELLDAKHNVKLLLQHLRAWDKNHENAQSRGHFLRKEMDKLNKDIYTANRVDNYLEKSLDRRIDDIVKEPTQEDLDSLT